jgi:hypothetical protein
MSTELSLTGTLWWGSLCFVFFFLVLHAHWIARTQTGQRLFDAVIERIRGRKREA